MFTLWHLLQFNRLQNVHKRRYTQKAITLLNSHGCSTYLTGCLNIPGSNKKMGILGHL